MNKFLKKIEFKKNKTTKKVGVMNPHRYWSVMIKSFLILISLFILLGFYVLFKIKNEQIFQITPDKEVTPVLINEKLLDNFNTVLRDKENRTLEINKGQTNFSDPS